MFEEVKNGFRETYQCEPEFIFSAPGRTELSGNHQHGVVLAAAVNRKCVATVRKNGLNRVRVLSKGYHSFEVDLNDLEPNEMEFGRPSSLVRGVASKYIKDGESLSGIDVYIISEVLSGSGLSSSAAFEVLFGTIFNELYCGGKYSKEDIARIGQYAENEFFGKPCGLMDQMASSVGNIIFIDFNRPEEAIVKPIPFHFEECGYSLCIIDSGASHEDLTDEYAAITQELKKVCKVFHKEFLREVKEEEFYAYIKEVREAAGDRATLRAIHIFNENKRVLEQAKALEENNFTRFLELVKASGISSWHYLQNVVPTGATNHQDVALALALCEKALHGKGACRVHGGGFAGTIQAFVPSEDVDAFVKEMEDVLGEGKCHVMQINPDGGKLEETLQ